MAGCRDREPGAQPCEPERAWHPRGNGLGPDAISVAMGQGPVNGQPAEPVPLAPAGHRAPRTSGATQAGTRYVRPPKAVALPESRRPPKTKPPPRVTTSPPEPRPPGSANPANPTPRPMKIATWNVNSIHARRERVLTWLRLHQPDVLCLQELKVTDDAFPFEAVEELGYHAAVHGQPTYNGVAILSRSPVHDVEVGMGPTDRDPQARLVAATVDGIRVLSAYVPNGARVGTDKYGYKLDWLRRLLEHLERTASPSDALVLAGDFNVAPRDEDVNQLDDWKESVLCHYAAREALARIREWGLADVFEMHRPEGAIYTWWAYQRLAFPRNNGLRIDHVYATERLAARSTDAFVDREARKKGPFSEKPSDHAPVVAEFDV